MTKSYTIQINESQRELISRALDHLYEVDIEFHEDLITDKFTDPDGLGTEFSKDLDELTDKGKDLYYLYKMFGTDELEQDGGLFSGDTLNGLCL